MKKLIALLLALVMIVGLVACGAKEEAAPAETEAAAPAETEAAAPAETEAAEEEHEPVTLTAWAYEDVTKDAFVKFAEDVNAKYPWITVEFEFLPYDSGPEKFTVACATGTTPDLMYDVYSRLSPAVDAGLCIDVTDIATANADCFSGDIKDGIIDGKNYYIATGAGGAYGIAINMDMVEKYGLSEYLPADGIQWSHEDFLNLCRAAKAAGITPFPLYAGSQSSDMWYYTWFLANGAEINSADLTSCVVNDAGNKEKIIEVLNVFKTMIDEGLTIDGPATTLDVDAQPLFQVGQTLMAHCGFNNASNFRTAQEEGSMIEMNFDIVAVPTATGDYLPRTGSFGGSGFVGFTNDGNKVDAVKLVLEYMTVESDLVQNMNDLQPGGVPTLSRVAVEYADPVVAKIIGERGISYAAQGSVAHFGVMKGWWGDFRQTFYPQMQDFYTGKIDAETVVANWDAAADQAIANYIAAN